MLLTIHNLPARTEYSDVKELIITKCGLRDSIVDNLENEGTGMRVTVGVMEEEDAALLVRKINGLYYRGQQLYVQDKRQKKDSEQPYRAPMMQQQPTQHQQYDAMQQTQAQYTAQMQAMANMAMYPNMANWYPNMANTAMAQQSVPNAYVAYGVQQQLMSQYTGLAEYGQQPYYQVAQDTENSFNQLEVGESGMQEQGWGDTQMAVDTGNDSRCQPALSPPQGWSPDDSQHESKRPRWESSARPDRDFGRTQGGHDSYGEVGRGGRSSERRGDFGQRGGHSSSQRGGHSSRERGGHSSSERGGHSSSQRGGHSSSQRGGNLSSQRGGHSSNQRGGHLSSQRGGHSSERGDRGRDERPDVRKRRWDESERGSDQRPPPPHFPPAADSHHDQPMSRNKIRKAKEQGMQRLLFDLAENLNVARELEVPSALKAALRQTINLRIVEITNDDFMEPDQIFNRYRQKYPRATDSSMYTTLKRVVAERGNDPGLKEYFMRFVNSSNRSSRPRDDRERNENNHNPRHESNQISRSDNNQGSRFDNNQSSRFDNKQSSRFDNNQSSRFDSKQSSRFDNNQSSRFDNYRNARYENNQSSRYEGNQNLEHYNKKPRFEDNQGSREQAPGTNNQNQWFRPGLKPMTRAQEMRSISTKAMLEIFSNTMTTLKIIPEMQGPSPLKSVLRKLLIQRVADIVGDQTIGSREIYDRYRKIYPQIGDYEMYTSLKQMVAERVLEGQELKDYLSRFIIPSGQRARSSDHGEAFEPQPSSSNYQKPPLNTPKHYDSPKPSYNPPKPSFNPPKPSYEPPKPSYNPPKPSLEAPKTSFDPPKPPYNPPKPSNETPKSFTPQAVPFHPKNPSFSPQKFPASLYPEGPGPNFGHKPQKVLTDAQIQKKEFRSCIARAAVKILDDLTDHLKIYPEMQGLSLLQNALRKVIMFRVANLLDGEPKPLAELCLQYSKKYPRGDDLALYKKVKHRIITTGKYNQVRVDPAMKVWLETLVVDPKPKKVPIATPPTASKKNKIPKYQIKATVIPPPEAGSSAAAVPNIPSYPQGDKKIHNQLKRENKLELQTLPAFPMTAQLDKALWDEVNAVGALVKKEFKNPQDAVDRAVYQHVNQEHCLKGCTKFLAHHISKRLTNSGLKLCRIYGHPRPPKRNQLMPFLTRYKCLSLKKSVKAPFLTASFDSFETIDELCSMGPINLGDVNSIVTFKPMHIAPPKPRFNQHQGKSLRKKYVKTLVENSKVNLLEKDWQIKEEEEIKAKAAKRDAFGSDDVIVVEDVNNTIDITQDDEPEHTVDGQVKATNDLEIPADVHEVAVGGQKNTEGCQENTAGGQENTAGGQENTAGGQNATDCQETQANEPVILQDDGIDRTAATEDDQQFLHEDFRVIDEVRESDNDETDVSKNNETVHQISDDWDQNGEDWGDDDNTNEGNNKGENSGEFGEIDHMIDEIGNILDDEDQIGEEIGENANDVNIADVDFDEDDLEDY